MKTITENSYFEGLKFICRDEITPYDTILLSKEPAFIKILSEIENILIEIAKARDDMCLGKFKWDENLNSLKWTQNMRKIFKVFCKLPEKQMVDLVELPGFRDYVDPFTLRIFMESIDEIFEHPERMKFLETISVIFEIFMRLQILNDINYMPQIDSRHIQLMNPFMRKNIRDINKGNSNFREKYINSTTFNIKIFCLSFFEK